MLSSGRSAAFNNDARGRVYVHIALEEGRAGIQAISGFFVVKRVFNPNFLQKARADLKAYELKKKKKIRIGDQLVFLPKHMKKNLPCG